MQGSNLTAAFAARAVTTILTTNILYHILIVISVYNTLATVLIMLTYIVGGHIVGLIFPSMICHDVTIMFDFSRAVCDIYYTDDVLISGLNITAADMG